MPSPGSERRPPSRPCFCSGSFHEAYRPLNVVLVTADTLRADRLPLYGYDRVETPNLDHMAAARVVFDRPSTAAVSRITLPGRHHSTFIQVAEPSSS